MTYSDEGLSGSSRSFHRWARLHKLANGTKLRKILLNSWEGVYFKINEDGKMHQIKVMDLPYGKFRDKGFPIDNVSNFDSTKEEIVYLCDDRELFFSKFLFVTKQGMIKKVAGSEFQVTKRTIAATKLQDEDALVSNRPIRDVQDVVLMTENGFVLRFPAEEVSEKKKGAVGVRGMKLQKNDSVEEVYLFEEGTESKVIFHEKEVTLNRLKRAKRDGTGTRMRK